MISPWNGYQKWPYKTLDSCHDKSLVVHKASGVYRLTPVCATDDDIQSLYEKAQIEDAEWFERVLGGKVAAVSNVAERSKSVDESDKTAPKSETPIITSKRDESTSRQNQNQQNNRPSDDSKELLSLGYSVADIVSMKESVIQVILESSVKRPRKGLPSSWIEPSRGAERKSNFGTTGDTRERETSSSASASTTGGSSSTGNRKISDDNNGDQRRNSRSSDDKGYVREKGLNENVYGLDDDVPTRESNVGEAFAWNGSPLTQDEVYSGQAVDRDVRGGNRDRGGERERGGERSVGRSNTNTNAPQKAKITRDDWDDVSIKINCLVLVLFLLIVKLQEVIRPVLSCSLFVLTINIIIL